MLSRVADAVYWMSRYIERAESVARFIDVSLHLSLDFPDPDDSQWAALVATTGDDGLFQKLHGRADREKVLEFLTFDLAYPNSMLSCVRRARENARSVREIISSEMWEHLNRTYLKVSEAARSRNEGRTVDPYTIYTAVKQASALFVGLMSMTMTHNEAWHFGHLGRVLERADKTSRILDVKYFLLTLARVDASAKAIVESASTLVQTPLVETQWAALLRSASALEMYRKRHGLIEPTRVVDFLMLEREFPRSILHCLTAADTSLHAISGTPSLGIAGDAASQATAVNDAERVRGGLHRQFEQADVDEIIARGLHGYLDDFQKQLNDVGQAIAATFFSAAPEDEGPDAAEQEGGGAAPQRQSQLSSSGRGQTKQEA